MRTKTTTVRCIIRAHDITTMKSMYSFLAIIRLLFMSLSLCAVVSDEEKSSGGASGGGEVVEVAPLMVDGQPHLPFQLQIEYTAQDGSRCMRVITQAKPITTDRHVAEKGGLCYCHHQPLKTVGDTKCVIITFNNMCMDRTLI